MICDKIKTADGQSGVLLLSNFDFKAWPFSWNVSDANDFTSYSTFDDGYVYCIIGKNLYRCHPDGSDCVKLG